MTRQLTLEQKAMLLSGASMQSTAAISEAGIPAIVMCDGPYGVRFVREGEASSWTQQAEPATCFPPGVAVGCSWDPAVAAAIGAAIAAEARAYGVALNLGPAMNIKRSPLCGRNFEYYSEDPLLTGVLASAYVSAAQAGGIGACPKHFAANNQETHRTTVSADVDERTLREIYLAAFERVVREARPAAIMSAYNRVNGVPASADPWLLTTVLREEWGFQGAVVSDWGAVADRVTSLRAGLDLEMPGAPEASAEVLSAVASGELDEAQVAASAERMITLSKLAQPPTDHFDQAAHHALARRLAARCAVLLKNDRDVLPLAERSRIAVYGPFAAQARFQGGGSSHLQPTLVETPLAALEVLAAERGATIESPAQPAAAAGADVAVVFAGLPETAESEGTDRTGIELPAEQIELILAVAAAAPRTVVVLSHGGVLSLEGWHDEVDAILDGFLLGQAGGGALADLLFGVANPSGHLAETIPLRLQDTPAYLNFPGEQGHVRYGEGVMVGYRHYASVDAPVRYPFGHGLSYTTFETTGFTVRIRDAADPLVDVELTVTNTGRRPGRHLVQLYVATHAGPVRRPARELRAFTQIELEPGESQTVTLELDRRAFAYFDVIRGGWTVAAGKYTIQLGRNAAQVEAETIIELDGEPVTLVLTPESTVAEWVSHPVAGPRLIEQLMAIGSEQPGSEEAITGITMEQAFAMIGSMPMRQFARFPQLQIPLETLKAEVARANEGAG